MSKYFVVTGGAGFIGFPLCKALLEAGHTVECVDDLRSSLLMPDTLRRLETFTDHFIWRHRSVAKWAMESLTQMDRIDGIFHLASPVGPVGVLNHGGSIARDILDDTMAVADIACEWNVRLVFVSTSEVYGGGNAGLCAEDMPCIVPPAASARLEYALGKLAAETALLNQRRMADADVVIIRPFNVAGPGQNAAGGFVLPRFLKHALAGMPLTVFGDGRAVRAFTHVADVVDGLLLAFDHGRSGQVYNLGNPANIVTIQQVAEAVLAAVGGGEIAYTDGVTLFGDLYAEANDKFPNADKAMHDLGWTPSRSLETIVQDTLAGLREELR